MTFVIVCDGIEGVGYTWSVRTVRCESDTTV